MTKALSDKSKPVSERDSWSTPQWLFNALDMEFNFALDAAASHSNSKVQEAYITKGENSLGIEWNNRLSPFAKSRAVWVNPPYSNIKPWAEKAAEQANKHNLTVVMLVPNTPEAGWFIDEVSEAWFITGGRISFIEPASGLAKNGNSKGSMIMIFKKKSLINQERITRYISRDSLIELGENDIKGAA